MVFPSSQIPSGGCTVEQDGIQGTLPKTCCFLWGEVGSDSWVSPPGSPLGKLCVLQRVLKCSLWCSRLPRSPPTYKTISQPLLTAQVLLVYPAECSQTDRYPFDARSIPELVMMAITPLVLAPLVISTPHTFLLCHHLHSLQIHINY